MKDFHDPATIAWVNAEGFEQACERNLQPYILELGDAEQALESGRFPFPPLCG